MNILLLRFRKEESGWSLPEIPRISGRTDCGVLRFFHEGREYLCLWLDRIRKSLPYDIHVYEADMGSPCQYSIIFLRLREREREDKTRKNPLTFPNQYQDPYRQSHLPRPSCKEYLHQTFSLPAAERNMSSSSCKSTRCDGVVSILFLRFSLSPACSGSRPRKSKASASKRSRREREEMSFL